MKKLVSAAASVIAAYVETTVCEPCRSFKMVDQVVKTKNVRQSAPSSSFIAILRDTKRMSSPECLNYQMKTHFSVRQQYLGALAR